MRQVIEQLVERDIDRFNDSFHPHVARYTRKPPWHTDTDFEWLGSFTPTLFDQRNFFRIIFPVTVRFRSGPKTSNRQEETYYQRTIQKVMTPPATHHLVLFFHKYKTRLVDRALRMSKGKCFAQFKRIFSFPVFSSLSVTAWGLC